MAVKRSLGILLILLVVFGLFGGYALAQKEKPTKPSLPVYTITEALEKGKIAVEAEGAGLSAVSVTITRTVEEKFKVLIPVGTYFIAKGDYQDMVSRKGVTVDLSVGKKFTVTVPASCANAYKKVPGGGDKFDIAASPQAEDLRKLMEVIGKKKPGETITQVAVWIVTNDISRGKLDSRYRRGLNLIISEPAASDEDVINAMALVEEAGIDLKAKVIYKERISAVLGLGSGSKRVQELSLKFLGAEGKNREEVLISALKDEDSDVREAAAKALGKIKDPRAVEPLISALKDEDSDVREAAAKALGEIKDPRAVEPLISALKDVNWRVRDAAAEALGEIKDPRAVEPLISALKDVDVLVREAAAKALRKITGQDFGWDQAKWQKWWEKNKGRFLKK